MQQVMERPAPACRAPIASRCCATPTATAWPRRAPCSSKDCTRRSAWRWSATISTSPTPTRCCASRTRPGRRGSPRPASRSRPAGGPDQPSLDQERHRQPPTARALRDGRLEQQRRRERHRGGGGPRRDLGDRSARPGSTASSRPACAIRTAWPGSRRRGALWTAVNERDELGSDLVPDYMTAVQGRRLLRLAVQLLRPARRRARASRSGPTSSPSAIVPDYALGAAHRVARPRVLAQRRLSRRAFAGGAFVGQHGSWNRRPPQRLQGDLRAVRRAAGRPARRRRADRLPRCETATRSAGRSAWRSIGEARCWSPTTSATGSGGSARPAAAEHRRVLSGQRARKGA